MSNEKIISEKTVAVCSTHLTYTSRKTSRKNIFTVLKSGRWSLQRSDTCY